MYDFREVAAPTTPAVLDAVAAQHPDRAFVIAEDGTGTYGEVARRTSEVAAGLTASGLRPGDRVGLLLANGLRWCITVLAAHTAGLCVVPLNTWYRAGELTAIARRAELRMIITEPEMFGHETGEVLSGTTNLENYLGTLHWPRDADRPVGIPELPPALLATAPVTGADDAFVLFTSGSSAEPKAVRLAHAGLVANGHAIGERHGVSAADRFWVASPLFFVFGCANALPNALTHGATLCVQERFEPAAALRFIERHRCTVYYGVAPMTRALAAHPDLARHDISSLRTGTTNATADDLRLAIETLGITEVCNAYGMTEAFGHSTMTSHHDPAEVRITTQGTPLPTQEVRIVDAGGAITGAGDIGEIQIRGQIMSGYLDGGSGQAFTPDGWFRTGDLGSFDGDGRLRYAGRSHEMIKAKGINISPAEVEAVLAAHPAVDQAFVFGRPTPDGDQTVSCALVPAASGPDTPAVDTALVQDVLAWAGERIAAYKVPTATWVVAVGDLPLTPTGKVSKRLLARALAARSPTMGTAGHPATLHS